LRLCRFANDNAGGSLRIAIPERNGVVMRLDLAVLGVAATVFSMVGPTGMVASASAQECPDVEVLFARGTNEAPGVGPTGQAFVDALRTRIGDQSLAG